MIQLVRYGLFGSSRVGVVSGSDYIDLSRGYRALENSPGGSAARALRTQSANNEPKDMVTILSGGTSEARRIAQVAEFVRGLPEREAREAGLLVASSHTIPLVPIAQPPKIICVARNYLAHAREAGLEVSETPILFPRFANTQVAAGAPIVVPKASVQVDWEGELAVVIGMGGRHVSAADAMKHVAGYTVFNDVSVRDYQFRVSQYTAGKNFSSSAPVGPSITLASEEIDPHQLRITTRVNGVVKQSAHTSEMIFSIPELIEHISEFIDLEPGDLIPTGTPAGVGFKRTPPEFLRPGDSVEVEIEKLGLLQNPVIAEGSKDLKGVSDESTKF